ncbi:MAG: tetratricopeptide repeat protein [Chloroflexota bacterium]
MSQQDPLSQLVAAAQTAAANNNYDEAIARQSEAIALVQSAGDVPEYLAAQSVLLFNLANFYEANGRFPEAISTLEKVVALDEQTQSPDLEQDRAALARMRHLATLAPDERAEYALAEVQTMIQTLAAEAQSAAQRGEPETAVATQEQAVGLAQQLGTSAGALADLGILLHNLAGYYQDAGNFDAAIQAMEAVVALDEQLGSPELEEDRESLEQLKQLAAMPKEERVDFLQAAVQTAVQLQQMNETEKQSFSQSVQQATQNLATMNPAERKMAMLGAAKEAMAQLAKQVRKTAVSAQRGQAKKSVLFAQIQQMQSQIADNTNFGVARYDFIAYLQAVESLVKGEKVKSVPKLYQSHIKAIRKARKRG